MRDTSYYFSKQHSQQPNRIRGGEKKVMKKSLSLLLVLALVVSMFATVASAADATSSQSKFDALKAQGIFNGYPDGTAGLDKDMTRAEFAKVLSLTLKLTEDAKAVSIYKDKDIAKHWAAPYIGAVTNAKLMTGAFNFFSPKANVTIEQLAKTLVVAAGLTPVKDAKVDGKVSTSWDAAGYVKAALDAKLIPAFEDYTVKAKRSVLVDAVYAYATTITKVVEVKEAKALDAKTVEVTFTDGVTQKFTLDTALVANKETEVTVKYLDKEYKVKVTFVSSAVNVDSLLGYTNTKVQVTLTDAVKSVDKSAFAIKDAAGKALEVKDATLSADGKKVYLTTPAQVAFSKYTLTVDGKSYDFVAEEADTTKPTAVVVAQQDATVKVTFSESVDAATATNAANYTFDKGVTVTNAALSGKVVTLTTSEQTQGTLYTLTIQNVTDIAGNAIDKKDFYVGGVKDTVKPYVKNGAVVIDAQGVLTVEFSEPVTAATATNVANYTVTNNLTVVKATQDADNAAIVYLETTEQTVGATYQLTVANVADKAGNVIDKKDGLYFGGVKDTAKPTVAAVTIGKDAVVTVQFSEKVDTATAGNVANYLVSDGVTVTKVTYSGANVYLTTTEQVVGKTYTLTIQNVADLKGNVVDKVVKYFGGVKDTTGPVPSLSSHARANQRVYITFDEPVDAAIAGNPTNYKFDGDLGYPSRAWYDADTNTVELKTAVQTNGKVYNATFANFKDALGNAAKSDAKVQFVGYNDISASLAALKGVTPVNVNTIDLIFSKEVDETLLGVTVTDKTTGTAVSVGSVVYKATKKSDKTTVTVQFATPTDKNPELFKLGHLYEVTVTGPIDTTDSANVKLFAGTNVANAAPQVLLVTPINKTAVKVTFSEKVSAVDATYFQISRTVSGVTTTITPSSVSASSGTDITLYLPSALDDYAIYDLTVVSPGIKDAAGFGDLVIVKDSVAVVTKFAGTPVTNTAPKVITASALDKYNFQIVFSEPVKGNFATGNYFTLYDQTAATYVSITGATYAFDTDSQSKVTVKLKAGFDAALVSGHVYKVIVNSAGLAGITDLQNLAYDATTDANYTLLSGVDISNAQPSIVAVEAQGNAIKVTFSEAVSQPAVSDFIVTINGTTVAFTVGTFDADDNSVVLTTSAPFAANLTGKIQLTGTSVKDVNYQGPVTDAVTFGTK